MPKLEFCRKYFELLKVITFVCSYYKTLREMMKVPYLDNVKKVSYHVPKSFPPIPVRYYTFHKIAIPIGSLIKKIEE